MIETYRKNKVKGGLGGFLGGFLMLTFWEGFGKFCVNRLVLVLLRLL